jgi:hypothetical protein
MVSTIRLSTDEVAFAVLVSGQPEAARQILLTSINSELSKEEMKGRLSAAGNILFGAGLVEIEETGGINIAPVLQEIVRVLTGAHATLRLTLNSAAGQQVLSYHFIDDAIYEHWLDRTVIHVISRVSETAVSEGCRSFFQVDKVKMAPDVSGRLPYEVLRQVSRQVDVNVATGMLRAQGLSGSWVDLLAADMVRPQAIGDMLAIYYSGENRMPTSDEGLLLKVGENRLWLFQPRRQDGEQWVDILPGTPEVFQDQVQQLVQVCQAIASKPEAVQSEVNEGGA